jgi:DNA-binding SARP family transcriptional activator
VVVPVAVVLAPVRVPVVAAAGQGETGAPVTTTDDTDRGITVHLFGGPYVSIDGKRRPVPEGSKRLLAFVALRAGRVERRHIAGTLWPVGDDGRAAGNLRSALWRLRGAGIEVMACDKWSLCLLDHVSVDVHQLKAWADRVIDGRVHPGDLRRMTVDADALDLLPGWYEDWTILERERLRQRILHGLEAQSLILTAQGRYADAVDAALAAVRAEPLRESAQRILIEAYLQEQNGVEAQRALDTYRVLLDRELGVVPSDELVDLIAYATRRQRRRSAPILVAQQA